MPGTVSSTLGAQHNHQQALMTIFVSRSAALLLSALVFSTAVAKSVSPRRLSPVENGLSYTLAESYVFKEKAATFTLSAGVYTEKFADKNARYLLGPGGCLEFNVVPPKNPAAAWTDTWDCGILLPKDPMIGAAFFMIRKTPEGEYRSGQGWIIDEIVKAGFGSFDFPASRQNDQVLRGKLRQSD
jgi:hypothetical protein